MGISTIIIRLITFIIVQFGTGVASPTVLVTRPVSRSLINWLPIDNQSVYFIKPGESKSLEMDTSAILQPHVYISISPCSKDIKWTLYKGYQNPSILKENIGTELSTVSVFVHQQEKYVLQVSSKLGGSVVVSVRGEPPRMVRLRLRFRSRRRLSANWDTSPIDPQSTTYCVVTSHRKNYTSLCAAQYDAKINRLNITPNQINPDQLDNTSGERLKLTLDQLANSSSESSFELDKNDIEIYNMYGGTYRNVFRRKKIGRSTKVTHADPAITCVGSRTHNLIENLDPSKIYFVSVFSISQDRRAGSLLALSSVKPKTSSAKRLRENMPLRMDIKGKNTFYFKLAVYFYSTEDSILFHRELRSQATITAGGGMWLAVSTCGGSVDVEVLVRGKRLYFMKNIEPHAKFFAGASTSSSQETSDEGSIQFDSSSEETRMRYVIKIVPSRRAGNDNVALEVTASTSRWGMNFPELLEDSHTIRELRPRRSCKSIDVAFLPATHNATDVIRYCVVARENVFEDNSCLNFKKTPAKGQCVNHLQRVLPSVIIQKVNGLKPGRKYSIHVTALNKGSAVPYRVLYADTNPSCKSDQL